MKSLKNGIEQCLKEYNVTVDENTLDSISLSISINHNIFEEDLISENDLYEAVSSELQKRGI